MTKNEGRDQQLDGGFTLIELLIVLLIVGILMAIAIPTFLTVTKGSDDTAAQSNLESALTAAHIYFTDSHQTFAEMLVPDAGTSTLTEIDPGVQYTSGHASTRTQLVSVFVTGAGSEAVFEDFSTGSNDCWGIVSKTKQGSASYRGIQLSSVGSYFFVIRNSTAQSCEAEISSGKVSASSPTSFPSS